uniref:Chlorophyll a-b binding protein, chloroplastic n=1 Tax=Picea sitchensis TaxID=3332 RepID=A9NQL6_PICSI|nr:unknown [Picea sitchensis]
MATAVGCSHVVAPVVFAGAFSSAKSRFFSPTNSLSLGVCNGSRVSMSAEWMPGQPRPPHLDGSAPGDFGFDPLRLGVVPENLERYKESELIHCRWAMLAVVVLHSWHSLDSVFKLQRTLEQDLWRT